MATTSTDAVALAIGFDEGTLTEAQYIEWASFLVKSGMVNSTGTFQRFCQTMYEAGYITREGDITDEGRMAAEEN